MSSNSAKKRKRTIVGDDEDGGVLASFKIPKTEDARSEDAGNQKTRRSNRKHRKNIRKHRKSKKIRHAKSVMRTVSKAGPATVQEWQASLARCQDQLARANSKYKQMRKTRTRKRLSCERRHLRKTIRRTTELLQKYHEFWKTGRAAAVEAHDDEEFSDGDDEGNLSHESADDDGSDEYDDESDDVPEPNVCHHSERMTLGQPDAQNAQHGLASSSPALKDLRYLCPLVANARPSQLKASPRQWTKHGWVEFMAIHKRLAGAVVGKHCQILKELSADTDTKVVIVDREYRGDYTLFELIGALLNLARAKEAMFKRLQEQAISLCQRGDRVALNPELWTTTSDLVGPSVESQPQATAPTLSAATDTLSKPIHPATPSSAQSKPESLPTQHIPQAPKPGRNNDMRMLRASAPDSPSSRKRLDEISDSDLDSDSSSSGSSSNGGQPASSPVLPLALTRRRQPSTSPDSSDDERKVRRQSKTSQSATAPSIPSRAVPLAHRPRTPQPRSPHSVPAERPPAPPTARASTPFEVPAGSAIVKIEDDSNEEQTPLQRPQTPPALRRAHDFGIVPVNNMVTLAEFEEILSMKETEKGKLEYKLKVLEYALHFKGVSDPQILRLMSRSGTVDGKKTWDPKFEGILGHPRQGRASDGRPLRQQDR